MGLKTGGQGKEIFDIADKLESGKEGVDVISLLPSGLPGIPSGLYNGRIPEFWEFKHYAMWRMRSRWRRSRSTLRHAW